MHPRGNTPSTPSLHIVNKILEIINERYGKMASMTAMEGKVHDYLVMTLYLTKQGKVIII